MTFFRLLFTTTLITILVSQNVDAQNGSINLIEGDFKSGHCYLDIGYKGKEIDLENYFIASTHPKPRKQRYVNTNTIVSGTTKWTKRKADSNCLSANPDDCLIWCLTEIGEIYYNEVTDTVKNKDFAIFYYVKEEIDNRKPKAWIEVICPNRVTPLLKEEVYEYLVSNKLIPPTETDELKIQMGYRNFQRENGFPIGMYDAWTMVFMQLISYFDQ